MKKKILLLINWKNRDLRPIVQLGLLLKKLNYDIYYANHKNALWKIYHVHPDAIVFPQVIAEKDKATLARKIGSKIIIIHSEGTVSPTSAKILFQFDPSMKIEEYTDLEIVWGQNFKDIVVKHTNIKPDSIKVCGNPRFDIYKKPLSILTEKRTLISELNLDPEKKILLFASNFVNLDKDVQMVKKNFGSKWRERLIHEKVLFERTIENLYIYFKKQPNRQLVIKIHPLELEDKYDKIVSLSNVYLVKNLDISFILSDIDLLLHTNSTVSSEASMIEKPVVTLMFEPNLEESIIENTKSLPRAHNYNEFEYLVEKYLNLGHLEEEILLKQKEFISRWFHKIDGQSTIRCVKEIDSFLRKKESINTKHEKLSFIDYLNILSSNPVGQTMISLLSRIKNGGKISYYRKILQTENAKQKDILSMEKLIERVYESSKYAEALSN